VFTDISAILRVLGEIMMTDFAQTLLNLPSGKNYQKKQSEGMLFVNSAPKIQCHVVKNTSYRLLFRKKLIVRIIKIFLEVEATHFLQT